MKTLFRTLAVLALSTVAAVGLTPTAAAETVADRGPMSVELDLEPTGVAGRYQASVVVSDAAGEVLAAPRITFVAGEPASTRRTSTTGEVVEVDVAVSADGTTASYTATLSRDGETISRLKSTIRL